MIKSTDVDDTRKEKPVPTREQLLHFSCLLGVQLASTHFDNYSVKNQKKEHLSRFGQRVILSQVLSHPVSSLVLSPCDRKGC